MRSIITLVCLFSACFNVVYSQKKLDYVWPIGYGEEYHSPTTGLVQGGILMNFNSSPPSLSLHSFLSDVPQAGICDTDGHLLVYTDGCRIYNRKHTLMLNGDTLNPGKVFNSFCDGGGYPLWQGCLFLPKPGSSNLYYLFHLRDDDQLWNPMDLLYSVVDAEGDNGDGQVIFKNQPVLSDSIWLGNYVSATRHANGRDWWVVVPRRVKNDFHVCLLTPEGVEYKGMQTIGDTSYQFCCGQTTFSPDGGKFFRHWPEGLQILDFDRCSGTFSNPLHIDYSDFAAAGGVAVSPGGRFLYITKSTKIYQYDLWAPDIVASRITVAEYDGYVSPFPTYFFQALLAPDGKIYIVSSNTNNILHVIHNPDSLGLACNVEQHGLQLPALTGYTFPNFANYRLYDLSGSPCDTLGINTPVATSEAPAGWLATVILYPNPSHDAVTLEKQGTWGNARVRLYSATGAVVVEKFFPVRENRLTVAISAQPPGFYFWEVIAENGQKASGVLQKE